MVGPIPPLQPGEPFVDLQKVMEGIGVVNRRPGIRSPLFERPGRPTIRVIFFRERFLQRRKPESVQTRQLDQGPSRDQLIQLILVFRPKRGIQAAALDVSH